jgi:hypothetical protein
VAKHSTEDRANSKGTLRACGHVSEHVPDVPLDTQAFGGRPRGTSDNPVLAQRADKSLKGYTDR